MKQPSKRLDEGAAIVDLPFRCPECNEPIRETAGNINENRVVCFCCGKPFDLRGKKLETARAIVKALDRHKPA